MFKPSFFFFLFTWVNDLPSFRHKLFIQLWALQCFQNGLQSICEIGRAKPTKMLEHVWVRKTAINKKSDCQLHCGISVLPPVLKGFFVLFCGGVSWLAWPSWTKWRGSSDSSHASELLHLLQTMLKSTMLWLEHQPWPLNAVAWAS